jgi:hypothetical protein
MSEPTCPYGSWSPAMRLEDYGNGSHDYRRQPCASGSTGWLCDRCKEDRSDWRFQHAVDTLAYHLDRTP